MAINLEVIFFVKTVETQILFQLQFLSFIFFFIQIAIYYYLS